MKWSWTKVGGAVGDLIDDQMSALVGALKGAEKYFPIHARAITSDATVTVLATIPIPVDTTVLMRGFVVARRTAGAAGSMNDGAGYRVEFPAKNTAGTAALIGAGSVTTLGESQAGWDVTLVASGGNILVKVTGAVNNTISWRWSGKSLSVKNEE